MTQSQVETVDVVVRFHDLERVRELSRALFSLQVQDYGRVQPILVAQNVPVDEVARAADEFDWSAPRLRPIVRSVALDPAGDHRSHLLNVGISLGSGRYLGFLDFDDWLYPDAYSFLVGRLKTSGAAIAFGRIVVKQVLVCGGREFVTAQTFPFAGRSLLDLLRDNFCPIHSYLVDRRAVEAADLHFDEGMDRLEDYEFLLRICSRYASDFQGIGRTVGVYVWRLDGTNTIAVPGATPNPENELAWQEARSRIEALKKRQKLDLTIAHLLGSD